MSNEKLSPEDYEKLKIFAAKFYEWYKAGLTLPPEIHPIYVLTQIQKEHGLANAKRGLMMGINDYVEDTANWRPDQVAEANAKLAAAGTFTLSEIRQRYSKKYLQILKRGVIRSETDYYLLKGILDGGGIEAGATESAQIQKLINEFEAKIMQGTTK
jgi:hypothetical protein